MTPDEFQAVLDEALDALSAGVGEDWTKSAGMLEWTCWQTVDHIIDCLFSYSLQLAAQEKSGFLPFAEIHAELEALPVDLLAGLRGIGTIFLAVARASSTDAVASDGVTSMGVSDWCARGAFETALHTYDVTYGWPTPFELSADLSSSILESQSLWMLDRKRAERAAAPWSALLTGSGRSS